MCHACRHAGGSGVGGGRYVSEKVVSHYDWRHMTADNETRDTKTCILVTSNGDIDRLINVFERTQHDTRNNQR